MNPKRTVFTNPRFRAQECVVIIMTALILAGILGYLGTDLFSSVAANKPLVDASHDSRRHDQGTKTNAPVGTAQTKGRGPEITQASAAKIKVQPDGTISPQALPAEAQALPALRPEANDKQEATKTERVFAPSIIGQTILAIAAIFALAVIAALAFVLGFFALLRRHGRDFGPLISIEYTGAPPTIVGPFTASSLGMAAPASVPAALDDNHRYSSISAECVSAHTAKASDFGGAFDAERQRMELKTKQQEAAVLQHLFEDNLKLQAEIGLAQAEQKSPMLMEADI